jgi:hypothetical protein
MVTFSKGGGQFIAGKALSNATMPTNPPSPVPSPPPGTFVR